MSSTAPAAILILLYLYLLYLRLTCTSEAKLALLKVRLDAYGLMKTGRSGRTVFADGALLPTQQHDILLGTLKKVEAKNAALFRAWTFMTAATFAFFVSEYGENLRDWTAVGLLAYMPFLWASLIGMRQLDLRHMPEDSLGVKSTAKGMQLQLMHDLLIKEASFAFAYYGAFGVLLLSGSIFLYSLFEGF